VILFAAMALAEPDRVAAVIAAGTGAEELAADGPWVGTRVTGAVAFLDTETWSVGYVSVCDGQGLASRDGLWWVGCDDGTVTEIELGDDGTLTVVEGAYAPGGAVQGLWSDGTNLFGVQDADGVTQVFALDHSSGDLAFGTPFDLAFDGFEDLVPFGTSLLVVQGSDDVVRLETGTGYATYATEAFGGADFIAGTADGSLGVLLADANGGSVARFDAGDSGFSPIFTGIVDEIHSVALGPEVLWVGADDALSTWTYSASVPGEEEDRLEGTGTLLDLLPVGDDDLFGVDDEGNYVFMTDRPWVEIQTDGAVAAVAEQTVDLTFTSDLGGAWTAWVGDATVLDSGEVGDGGTDVASFIVSSSVFEEGSNRVRIEVNSDGKVGSDAVDVTVDNPPGAVTLGAGGVGVGDGQLRVEFDGLDDADLDVYVVYLSTTPFTAEDHPTGGPTWDGPAAVDAPRTVAASPGKAVGVSFYPLENGTTYYVAVRATDATGYEGPMSDVQSGTPIATYSASQLAGEPGGCATVPGAGLVASTLALALGLRRRGRPVLAAAAFLSLLVPATARAEDAPVPHMNVAVHGGPITLADPHIRSIFGKVNKSFGIEYGATSRFAEVSMGIAFYQELGFLPTEDGGVSVEHDMLTVVPLSVSGTLRLDLAEEQFLVPFARIGGDYAMWKENWYVYEGSTEESMRKGGKIGWHWGAGGMILLDNLDQKASSRLRASAGIDDTFLVVEYRRTQMPKGEDVLLLSAEQVRFGVKFDF